MGRWTASAAPPICCPLAALCLPPANTASYIRIVQEKSTLRKLISACRDIEEACFSQMDDLETTLNNAERLIFDIVMRRSGTDTLTPISAVLMENLR